MANEWTMADEWLCLNTEDLNEQVWESEKERLQLIGEIQGLLLERDKIKVRFVSEDFVGKADTDDIQRAIDLAGNSDLDGFVRTGIIPYEDGYLQVYL